MMTNHPADASSAASQPSSRLAGEVAIITGATSGLGKSLAVRFAAEGAKVVVAGRNHEAGNAVCHAIASTGGEAVFAAADLQADNCGETLATAAVETFGKLTILINNAVDIKDDGPVAQVEPASWERILRVGVVAAGLTSKAAILQMAKTGGGVILNISSRTAERASPRLAAYTAAKGALNALTRSIALDYAHLNIRCNAVQLGYIFHENRDALNSPQRQEQIEAMCLTRPATAEDVCHACVYLASREAEVVTGITLNIDSGSTAARAATFDVPLG